jgi:hypothetical protein
MTTGSPPTYTITFLGSSELYDVYDVVIYPDLLRDADAQARYKQQVQENLARAKAERRKVWGAVDLSRLSLGQLVSLTYKTVLPFIREPMVFKVYGTDKQSLEDEEVRTLDWLVRHSFKMAIVKSRVAALPPNFVPQPEQTT